MWILLSVILLTTVKMKTYTENLFRFLSFKSFPHRLRKTTCNYNLTQSRKSSQILANNPFKHQTKKLRARSLLFYNLNFQNYSKHYIPTHELKVFLHIYTNFNPK